MIRLRAQLSFPLLVLVALLQRTPLLRVAVTQGGEMTGLSPGHVLRSGLAMASALGAIDTLAGATTFVWTPTSTPAGTYNVSVGDTVNVSFTITDTPSAVKSFKIQGTLPPGLAIAGLASGVVNNANPVIAGTPTTAGTYKIEAMAYDKTGATGKTDNVWYATTFIVTGTTASPPAISTQPAAVTVTAGASATFSVVATGTAPLTYQWKFNGSNISGATAATYSVSSAQSTNAGNYSVTVTNSAGTVTSNSAALTVNPVVTVVAPVFSIQPLGATVSLGQMVALNASAQTTGGTTSYQWYKDATSITGATGPILLIASASLSDAGTYTVKATSGSASTTSNAAVLSIGAKSGAPLANVSALTTSIAGDPFTMGFVITGSTAQTVLIRAAGPTLAAMVPGSMADPILSLYNSTPAKIAENDDWNASLASVFNQVGAFAFTPGSKDSAFLITLPPGGYTVQVKATDNSTGKALAEVYLVVPAN